MRQFCCVLCGALFLKLAASSFSGSTPKVLIEPKPAKAPLKANQLNSTKLKGSLDQLEAPLEPKSTKDKLKAPLKQLKAPLESHLTKDKVPLESISTKDPVGASGNGHNQHKALRQKPKLPMLELMSLSLENWGARSAHHRSKNLPESMMVSGDANFEPFDRGDANDEPFHKGDASFQPFDQILSSDGGDHFNPLAQVPKPMNMFDVRGQQAHPLNFAQYAQPQSNLAKNLMLVILALVALLIVAYLMSCLCCDGLESDDEQASADPKEDKAAAMKKIGDFTWTAAYAEAEGEQKEAFELLFRCNMISTEEFSHGEVSQEHIQDCTWIAKHMLQHKPLEEWVGLWQQAQRSFEDSVADCFEARGGQVGLGARALAQRLTLSRSQFRAATPSSPHTSSRPSSANLDFVSDASLDLRPLHS